MAEVQKNVRHTKQSHAGTYAFAHRRDKKANSEDSGTCGSTARSEKRHHVQQVYRCNEKKGQVLNRKCSQKSQKIVQKHSKEL